MLARFSVSMAGQEVRYWRCQYQLSKETILQMDRDAHIVHSEFLFRGDRQQHAGCPPGGGSFGGYSMKIRCIACMALVASSLALAQEVAQVSGIATDQSGAVVPG